MLLVSMKMARFKAAKLEDRKNFYEKEFDFEKVKYWFEENGLKLPELCAMDYGSDNKTIGGKKVKGYIVYLKTSELKDKVKKFFPDDVYYDRNLYADSDEALKKLYFDSWKEQELVFDVDSDNFDCTHENEELVCNKCLESAFDWSKKLEQELRKKFKKTEIVYSGKGFHVHIFDREAFLMTKTQRKELVESLKRFFIDGWVSEGNINLIRMPFTLNAELSRIVIPVRESRLSERFFEEITPKFLN